MSIESSFVIMFVVATAVALAARRLRLPYTVALVLAGLALGFVPLFQPPHLTRQLLYSVFLPGLLFEAAFHVEFTDFWNDRTAIVALAVPGVAAAIILTAAIFEPIVHALGLGQGIEWEHAVLFGALVAATDPIAVVSMFKSLGAPRRLSLLIEGESLLNDGTTIVLLALVLDVVTGKQVSPTGLTVEFVRIVGGGLAIGVLIGLGISQIIRQIDDPMIEITLTTLAAYGSFLAADRLGFSGVIATVTAGMLCGNYASRGMSPTTRIAAETFWDYIAFALNSIVFLLVGLRVHIGELVQSWEIILAAYGAVTLARAGIVFSVSMLNRTNLSRKWPLSWSTIITWGGMRGSLSMVLALALPAALPQRDLLITVTFGVVLLSILIQGLTMGPLLRKLGIIGRQEARRKYQLERGELRMIQAALNEIDHMERLHLAPSSVLKQMREEYEKRSQEAAAAVEDLQLHQEDLRAEEASRARRQVLLAEKEEVLSDYHRGTLAAEAYNSLLGAVDARLAALDRGEPASKPADGKGPRPDEAAGQAAEAREPRKRPTDNAADPTGTAGGTATDRPVEDQQPGAEGSVSDTAPAPEEPHQRSDQDNSR
jgi:Na+:H+ antiporter